MTPTGAASASYASETISSPQRRPAAQSFLVTGEGREKGVVGGPDGAEAGQLLRHRNAARPLSGGGQEPGEAAPGPAHFSTRA